MADAVDKSVKLKGRIQVITTKQKQIQDTLKTDVLDVLREIQVQCDRKIQWMTREYNITHYREAMKKLE